MIRTVRPDHVPRGQVSLRYKRFLANPYPLGRGPVVLRETEKKLEAMSVLSPRAEAEQLLCHFGRVSRLELMTGNRPISAGAESLILSALKKRARGIPLAHLTGTAPFYGRDFIVSPDVLIPRPETERLVEETLKLLMTGYKGKAPDILDMGTGSGCIAASLTLEGPPCRMTAIDASEKALAVARKNFKRFGLQQKVRSLKSRFFSAFGRKTALWDVIVSNPPYIPASRLKRLPVEVRREPRIALDGGKSGLDAVETLLREALARLKPGGWLLVEIGDGQSKRLAAKRRSLRVYESFRFEKDLNGIERILIARKSLNG